MVNISYTWPHPHLPHAIGDYLTNATNAQQRVTTLIPRVRTYPLLVVASAGLGALGMDSAIQADEPRLQIDSWALTLEAAQALAGQIFRLLDARFTGALKDTILSTEDEATPGSFYQTKVEKITRSGGGEAYWDEFAKVFRVTTFYSVKVNL